MPYDEEENVFLVPEVAYEDFLRMLDEPSRKLPGLLELFERKFEWGDPLD